MGLFDDNPKLKQTMLDGFMHDIYAPYHARREKILMNLVTRNCVLKQSKYECFTFRGVSYGKVYTGVYERPKLHPNLIPEFQAYLEEESQVQSWERPYISNFLIQVMNWSDSPLDWMQVMPECLHRPAKILLENITGGQQQAEKTPAQWQAWREANEHPIQLITSRMITNLLLQ